MITETHIRQWADRKEAQSLLPVLLRRLIRETTPELSYIRFPGNDAVALHGVDGETEVGTPTPWVPSGTAFWEMGCDRTPGSKASGDYDKRIDDFDSEKRRSMAFVFVTPRRWPGKEKWLQDRRARGDWAEVHAWDAVDLETWLDEAPATRLWLTERLGLHQTGMSSPEDWYRTWASASSPNIPSRLVAERRGGVAEALIQKLREGDRVIPVVADSRQEAVAFCIAALENVSEDDFLDRMVVVTAPDAIPSASNGPKPILVLDLPHGEKPTLLDRDRFQIIRPMAKGEAALREQLELPHVGAETFREALEEAGLSRDEAQRWALEVGHSVTVLRRRLSDDPAVRLPAWAQDPVTARKLLPFALAGGWIESGHHNDLSLLALLAETTDDDVARADGELAKGEDAPLARIGNVTMTVSQLDALFAVGPHIEPGDLDRFFLLAVDALGERDPKLDLPEDEWWCANIHGKSRAYSAAMLSGVGDTLGILSTYGEAICGKRLNIDLPSRIDRHVRDLMSDMTSDAWISLRPHLRALAEAAPVAFLDCIEADLARPDQPISAIMRCAGDSGLTQTCLRAELLWALEALAWSPKYFSRVAEVVFRLCAFETDDNYSNKPARSAAALFRDWLPSTTLDIESRMRILHRLAPAYRSAVIEVCKSLIASGPRFGSRTVMPRWLAVEGDYDVVSYHDCRNARRSASKLLLDLTPLNIRELSAVLDILDRLHSDDLGRLYAEVERWSNEADDFAKAELAKIARAKIGQLQFRLQRESNDVAKISEDQALVSTLDRMLGQLQPCDPRQRHLWLFEKGYIHWPRLDSNKIKGSIRGVERSALVKDQRREALDEIQETHGKDALYAFALQLENPRIAAQVLAGSGVPQKQSIYWAIRAMGDTEGGAKSDEFLAQVLLIQDEEALADVVKAIEDEGLLSKREDLERLGRSLPSLAAGWRLAERIGGTVRDSYWLNAQIQIFHDEEHSEAEFVTRRLLAAGRPRHAYHAACNEPQRLPASLWVEILSGIIQGPESEGPLPDSWDLERILLQLDEATDVTDAQIAALEWPFARLLESYGADGDRPIWAIHRLLISDHSEYIGLLRWLYRRADGAPEPDMDAIAPDQLSMRADLTYHVLQEWSQIPGTRRDGSLDEGAFREWSSGMLRLAEEHGRLRPALSNLADCLARVAKQRGLDDWLPEVVLDFLDRVDLGDLRRSFEVSVHNARGTTMRRPFDGGVQERELALQYRELGERKSNDFPRVAAMLDRISESYKRDAKREDDRAQLGERWRP